MNEVRSGYMSSKFLLSCATLCVALSVLACWMNPPADPKDTNNRNNIAQNNANNVTMDDDCGSDDKPCLLSEVSDAVLVKSFEAMFNAQRLNVEGKSPEEVAQWLKDEGALDVFHDQTYAVFRFAGGTRMYIRFQIVEGDPADSLKTEPNDADESRPNGLVVFDPVRGRERKRALLLAPFDWEFSKEGEEKEHKQIASAIETVPGFKGNVVTYTNNKATLDRFTEFADYDLIHLSTHGVCIETTNNSCQYVALSTGTLVGDAYELGSASKNTILDSAQGTAERLKKEVLSNPKYAAYKGLTVDANATLVDPKDKSPGAPYTVFFTLSLEPSFFKQQYPNKLKNKLFYTDACESLKDTGNTLPDALLGEGSAYLGWSESVNSSASRALLKQMYEQMGKYGFGAKQALVNLGDKTTDKTITPNATLGYYAAADTKDSRLREVISILRSTSTPTSVKDAVALPDRAAWELVKDGDKVKISALVEGLTDDEVSQSSLTVWINGKQVGETSYALKDHSNPFDEAHDGAHLIEGIVVDPGQTFEGGAMIDLEVRLKLPEGGESIDIVREMPTQSEVCFGSFASGGISYTSPMPKEGERYIKFGQITANNPFETARKIELILQSQDPNSPQAQLTAYSPNEFTGPGQYPVTLVVSLEGANVSEEFGSKERYEPGSPSGTMIVEAVEGSGSSRLVRGTIFGSVYALDEQNMVINSPISTTGRFLVPIDDQTLDPSDMSMRLYDPPKWNEVCGLD